MKGQERQFKKRLFVDMDGVLAEWRTDKTTEDTYEKDYFKNLSPYQNVLSAVKEIAEIYPEISVNILSAVFPDNPYAIADKTQWLKRYLPEIGTENIFFVDCGCKKTDVCSEMTKDDILLDDYNNNLIDWRENGGTAIKIYNGVNSNNGDFDRIIDKDKNAETIVLDILDTVDALSWLS